MSNPMHMPEQGQGSAVPWFRDTSTAIDPAMLARWVTLEVGGVKCDDNEPERLAEAGSVVQSKVARDLGRRLTIRELRQVNAAVVAEWDRRIAEKQAAEALS